MRERGARPEEAFVPSSSIETPAHVAPINWWKLDELERAEVLGLLQIFVPELVRRYALPASVVPPCWFRHEATVQELLAFYQFREQMQFPEEATSHADAPLETHIQFYMLRGRLRELNQCNEVEHHEDRIQGWSQPGTAAAAQWVVEFVDANSAVLSVVPDFESEGRIDGW